MPFVVSHGKCIHKGAIKLTELRFGDKRNVKYYFFDIETKLVQLTTFKILSSMFKIISLRLKIEFYKDADQVTDFFL